MSNTTSNSTFNTTFYDSSNGTWNSTSSTFTAPIPKPFWTGLLLPIAYLIILIGSLYSFSSVYRQRQLARASKLEPWFPNHVTRNIYLSLLHLDPAEGGDGDEKALSNEKGQSKVPDSVLKAALLKRAVEDIQRIVQLRQAKPALQTLLQRGSVGDELWQRFQRAEQEMEVEVKDVVEEVSPISLPSHSPPCSLLSLCSIPTSPKSLTTLPPARPTPSPPTGAK
jgi:translocation protein SEC66